MKCNFAVKLCIALALLLFSLNASYCAHLKNVSNDPSIIKALNILKVTQNKKALNAIREKKSLKIVFYNLSLMSFNYKDHYALATSDGYGTDYILINSKYENSPIEALSSIIAHELTHKLNITTAEEEVQAWVNETKQWINCKKLYPKLAFINEEKYQLVKRLNNLEKLYYRANKKSTLIADKIKNNIAYRKLALR